MSLRPFDRITPFQVIIMGFILLISLGTALLLLPISTRAPGGAPLIDALFTAVSASCVTGLILHDTAQYWSSFGQGVILSLIQIGGMGVVTIGLAVFMLSGRKISLKQRWIMQESISAPQVGGIVRQMRFILYFSCLIELLGMVPLAIRFCSEMGPGLGLWYAVFHSISAFCNAGFDLMGIHGPAFASLTAFKSDPIVQLTICFLIISGGLGFLTWQDIRTQKYRLHRYRLQSKLVLATTFFLLLGGALFFFFCEFCLSHWNSLNTSEKILAALFHSTTTRTAGFNTVDLSLLSPPGQLLTILLMLIGGSPGSTAGGFKITTLAVLLLSSRAVFQRKPHAQCFGRRISDDVLRNASAIFMLYLVLFFTGGVLICCIDGIPLMGAMFEAASAIGTVGLSLGYTPILSTASHLILIFLMYFGRVGGLTMIYAVMSHDAHVVSQLPEEYVFVG